MNLPDDDPGGNQDTTCGSGEGRPVAVGLSLTHEMQSVLEINVKTGASIIPLKSIVDERGVLTFAEIGDGLPFSPVRLFLLSGVPSGANRGGHAHRACQQFLVATSGAVRVIVKQPSGEEVFHLNTPGAGLFVPPMYWLELDAFAPSTALLVLASHPYDAADYIRSWDQFVSEDSHG